MEDFSTYLVIIRTYSLICCMFWIFFTADGKTISQAVGSRVILYCDNKSISTLTQLTWKMKNVMLLSFNPELKTHISPEARNLNINMSQSGSQQYALIIERAHMSHTGNYTCEITSKETGPQELKWELIITEPVESYNWHRIAIGVAVPCVCCLVFIISLTILQRVCKQRAENSIPAPTAEMQGKTEDIYENCLETDYSQQSGYNQP